MRSKTYAKHMIPLIEQYCMNYNATRTGYDYGLLCGICDAALSIGVVIIIRRFLPDGRICNFTVEYTDRGRNYKNKYDINIISRIEPGQTVYEFCRGRRWYWNIEHRGEVVL